MKANRAPPQTSRITFIVPMPLTFAQRRDSSDFFFGVAGGAEMEAAEAVFLPRRFFLFFRPEMTAAARYSATAPTTAAVAAITTTV